MKNFTTLAFVVLFWGAVLVGLAHYGMLWRTLATIGLLTVLLTIGTIIAAVAHRAGVRIGDSDDH